jgi:UDP-N-acetylglucosamine acyltransferase
MAIHPTAIVEPKAQLGREVEIGPFSWVRDGATLGDGVVLGAHCVVGGGTTIGEGTRVYHHAVLGEDPQDKKYRGEPTRLEIGAHNVFREFTTVSRGTDGGGGLTRIGDHNLFMAYSHVAHDCRVGSHCVFANSVNLAGHVEIQDAVVLGGLVGVHQHSRIGRCAMVGGGGMAAQDVPPFTIAQGDRARLFGLNIVGLRRNGYSLEVITALKGAYRELFNQGLPLRIALEQVREVYAEVAEVAEVVRFIEGSTRGICRSAGADPVAEV